VPEVQEESILAYLRGFFNFIGRKLYPALIEFLINRETIIVILSEPVMFHDFPLRGTRSITQDGHYHKSFVCMHMKDINALISLSVIS